jgi:fucose permease
LLIVAAVVAIFVYGMTAAMLGTILPELSSRFQLTPRQNGTIALAQALGLMLASLAVGPLLDDFGKKVGLILGLALIGLSLNVLPKITSYHGIVFLLFLLGCGGGIVVTGANALTSDVSEAHRAAALNLVNIFFGLGGLATPFIAANLFRRNWVRLCYSVAGLALVVLLVQVVVPMPPPAGAGRFILADAGPVLGRPILFLLGFLLFLYVGCEVDVWNWLVRHLVEQGVPESRALNILSLGFALGLLLGRALVSPILISVPPAYVTLSASIAMTITTFLMLRTNRAWLAALLVLLAGLSMAPVFPTTLAIVADAFPRMTSTAIGFVITCGWAGLAVSSHIIGAIAGGDPKRIRRALLVIPVSSALMIAISLGILTKAH